MPSGGRRGSLLALAVLGVLVQRPMHPYEMASVLREYGKDASIKIKWGSLYTVVATLEKRRLIKATGTTRQGGRPERTVYEMTDEGRVELTDWLRELLSLPQHEYPKFEAALSLLAVLPPDEVAGLLATRLRRLDGEVAAQRAALQHYRQTLPRLFLIETEYHLALLEAEAEWVRGVVAEFTAGTFPNLADWGDYHRTGVIPDLFIDPVSAVAHVVRPPPDGEEPP